MVMSQKTAGTSSGHSLRRITIGLERPGPKRLSISAAHTLWTKTARLSTGSGARRIGRDLERRSESDGQTCFVFILATIFRICHDVNAKMHGSYQNARFDVYCVD